jgi:hypothetical protein
MRSPRVSSLFPSGRGKWRKLVVTRGSLAVVAVKDVFIWAYERSAERYAAVRQSLGDPFRQRHREALRQLSQHESLLPRVASEAARSPIDRLPLEAKIEWIGEHVRDTKLRR